MTSFYRVQIRDPSSNRSREIAPEAVEGGIVDRFFPYHFRPEVDNDVISGVTVDNVGLDDRVQFGDSRSNIFRYIRGADFGSNERTNRTKPSPTARDAAYYSIVFN